MDIDANWIAVLVAALGAVGGFGVYKRAKHEAPLIAAQAQDIIIKNLRLELERYADLTNSVSVLTEEMLGLRSRIRDIEGEAVVLRERIKALEVENKSLRRENGSLKARMTKLAKRLQDMGINPHEVAP